MKAELTAIIEPAPDGGYWAVCPEVPGANGQGETVEETKQSLRSHRTDLRGQKVGHHAWPSRGCDTGKNSCRVKRKDLERRLRIAGCFLKREAVTTRSGRIRRMEL
jgi:hypothetical protein